MFGDPVIATTILDRILHHSHVTTIRGGSYCLREKRRSGLLSKQPTPKAATLSPLPDGQFLDVANGRIAASAILGIRSGCRLTELAGTLLSHASAAACPVQLHANLAPESKSCYIQDYTLRPGDRRKPGASLAGPTTSVDPLDRHLTPDR